jgi:hypothetical protein
MNEKATRTNDTAAFALLSMTIPPLMIFLVSRFAKVALQRLGGLGRSGGPEAVKIE